MNSFIDPVINLCSRYLAFEKALGMAHGATEWERLAEQQDRILDRIVSTPAYTHEGTRAKMNVLIVSAEYFIPGDDFLFDSIKRDFETLDMAYSIS